MVKALKACICKKSEVCDIYSNVPFKIAAFCVYIFPSLLLLHIYFKIE